MDFGAVNQLEQSAFVAVLGAVFENSPWVAEQAWRARPHASVAALHAAMVEVVRAAPAAHQLALLRAHPELAGCEARAGTMTPDSVSEQTGAGLVSLTAEEFARIGSLNAAYRTKFGHPFIIAVRNHTKHGIFAAFERRLNNTAEAEREAALSEVFTITRLRLDAIFAPAAARAV